MAFCLLVGDLHPIVHPTLSPSSLLAQFHVDPSTVSLPRQFSLLLVFFAPASEFLKYKYQVMR